MENTIIRPEWVPSGYLEGDKNSPIDNKRLTAKTAVFRSAEKSFVQKRLPAKKIIPRKLKRKRSYPNLE